MREPLKALGFSGGYLQSEFFTDREIDIDDIVSFKEAKTYWYLNWLYLKNGSKILMSGSSKRLGTGCLIAHGIKGEML